LESDSIPKNSKTFLEETDAESTTNAACFRLSNIDGITSKVQSFLLSSIRGLDTADVQIEQLTVTLKASYIVDYSINSDFSTSVGLVHSIHKTSHLLLDETGEFVGETINNALYTLKDLLVNTNELDASIKITDKGSFKITNTEIRELAKQLLIRRFTETVGYYGRNNVHYHKTCSPKPKDVQVLKVRKAYVPIWSIIFTIKKTKYAFLAVEDTSGIVLLAYQPEIDKSARKYPSACMICGGTLTGEGKYICKECGKICCTKDTFHCTNCGKQLCREHITFKRKFIFLKDKYCSNCFGTLSSNKR
jgi:hypothetical protein